MVLNVECRFAEAEAGKTASGRTPKRNYTHQSGKYKNEVIYNSKDGLLSRGGGKSERLLHARLSCFADCIAKRHINGLNGL